MSQITTHILDTSLGKPACEVNVFLNKLNDQQWSEIAKGTTDSDGRITNLLSGNEKLDSGTYMLRFMTENYFLKSYKTNFYPWVDVVFNYESNGEHYHVPLLLSPYGYSTYRGS